MSSPRTGFRQKGKAGPAPRRAAVLKALVEMGSIIFLFYSNLLMGEYTRSQGAAGKSLWAACWDVVTWQNFSIAVVSSFLGYRLFEHFRKKI